MKLTTDELGKLNQHFAKAGPEEILKESVEIFGNRLCFASSLGYEDQVLTQIIAKQLSGTEIFTLDTGRLFPETYDLIERTNARYKINIRIYFPDHKEVEEMVNQYGINLFYQSIDNRKLCCAVRKTHLLKRSLHDRDAWITGLRREQSVTRQNMQVFESDSVHNIIKINPLLNWSEEEVIGYIRENNIPYNILHDQGFPSIGCQPCTRAINDGEDIRAGRWWWESPDSKECGLHK